MNEDGARCRPSCVFLVSNVDSDVENYSFNFCWGLGAFEGFSVHHIVYLFQPFVGRATFSGMTATSDCSGGAELVECKATAINYIRISPLKHIILVLWIRAGVRQTQYQLGYTL